MRTLTLVLVAIALGACSPVNSAFTCFSSSECGTGGTCEPNGFCSFGDNACASGRRYGSAVDPAHKDQCVGDEGDEGDAGTTQYPIRVMVSGDGTVQSDPVGLTCAGDCTAMFDAGQLLTLTATPQAGQQFIGWGGLACTGAGVGACAFTVAGQRTITATFTTASSSTPDLFVNYTGEGTVTSTPAGIQCGSGVNDTMCFSSYAGGTSITLHAAPAANAMFTGWSGGSCTGIGDCAFLISSDTHVSATFAPATTMLTVTKLGTGTGMVTSAPGGISCAAICAASFPTNSVVSLTAVADAGSVFAGWTGGGCSGTAGCTVTLAAATTVTAQFDVTAQLTLTVTKSGTGVGTVSSVSGIDCGATCSKPFGAGTMVSLTATAMAGSTFAGWTGACSGTGACAVTIAQAQSVNAMFTAANPNANYVFVTSTRHDAALGGIAGADAICQARAAAGFIPGTFRAFLSTTTVNAIDRLAGARGWIRVDGRPVVDTTADLTSSRLLYPIAVDELGHQQTSTDYAFTGSGNDGKVAIVGVLSTCTDFTSASSTDRASAASPYATDGCALSCSNPVCSTPEPLLCFGVDRNSAVAVPIADARRAFVSSSSFTPGGGLSAADGVCQSDATLGGQPGTYKALLATTTASAISRFDTSAAAKPWARPDNVLLAPTAAALATVGLARLDAPPTRIDHFGPSFWSGSTLPTALGTASSTCNDWVSTSGSAGARGESWDTAIPQWFGIGGTNQLPCTTAFPLVCLQQ